MPKTTFSIFFAVTTGLTLFGATSYFVYSKIYRAKSSNKKQNRQDCLQDLRAGNIYMMDSGSNYGDEDFDSELQGYSRKNTRGDREDPPPLITFDDLNERAIVLDQTRKL
jgi:hypothetical protein